MLSDEERAGGELWDQAVFGRVQDFASALIEERAGKEDLVEASINLGPADHMLVPLDRPDAVVKWIRDTGKGRAVGFITVSAVGKSERVRASVDAWRAAVDKYAQPVSIDMVFDPVKTGLAKFQDVYAGNIAYIRNAFGAVDLNINVGADTIGAVDPEALHAFMRENGLANLTLNLVPTPWTAKAFAERWDEVLEWLQGTIFAWRPDDLHGYNPCVALAPYVETEGSYRDSGDPLAKMAEAIADKASMEVLLDAKGGFCFSQAGFGDTPFSTRFGFQPSGRTDGDPQDAPRIVDAAAKRFAAAAVAAFAKDRSCSACPHLAVCVRSGFGVARKVMGPYLKPSQDGCPLRIRTTLEAMARYMEQDRDMSAYDEASGGIFVPHGFSKDIVPHAVPTKDGGGSISFSAVRNKTAAAGEV